MPRIRKLNARIEGILHGSVGIRSVEDVVRELLQNSIDSDASQVDVTIEIDRVNRCLNVFCKDNGYGIDYENLNTIGRRYFTSKFYGTDTDGMNSITTYGFRGEALDSIIQVSSVCRVVSKTCEDNEQWEIIFTSGARKGGVLRQKLSVIETSGTSVYVYNVFGPIAVRKYAIFNEDNTKYMSDLFFGLRREIFITLAKTPSVRVSVTKVEEGKEDKLMLFTNGCEGEGISRQVDILRHIYGEHVISCYKSFSMDQTPEIHISMAVGFTPAESRNFQFVFLNGRPLLDKKLLKRIRNSFETHNFGYVEDRKKRRKWYRAYPVFIVLISSYETDAEEITQSQDKTCDFTKLTDSIARTIEKELERFFRRRGLVSDSSKKRINCEQEERVSLLPLQSFVKVSPYFHNMSEIEINKAQFSDIKVIGQMYEKFILTRVEREKPILVAIDQHACAERIKVEQLYEELIESTVLADEWTDATKLNNPISIKLSEGELELSERFSNTLTAWGIGFSRKQGLFTITNLPELIQRRVDNSLDEMNLGRSLKQFMADMNNSLKLRVEKSSTNKDWWCYVSQMPEFWKQTIKSISCKQSVKFGERLTTQQCVSMVGQLGKCREPFYCAHGRPSIYPICQY
ncbi:hypothetical protein FOA43_001671 [Brettanomyces nanus]|uniref:MutL C-terminal dimerisation domain-containing protein n=1 Tax=Eeniella nana TaxID=13502 RepID=A0A875S550_EENNA|nr:uncharacterized protein FOA43_001671 [Brettanomyces nanus]QPG74344.1 hypothetical protein FOA43_001671 [Brettanomyces nanus]